jgi:hypothetical protein
LRISAATQTQGLPVTNCGAIRRALVPTSSAAAASWPCCCWFGCRLMLQQFRHGRGERRLQECRRLARRSIVTKATRCSDSAAFFFVLAAFNESLTNTRPRWARFRRT